MTYTYSESQTQTRTITHAERIAVYIKTDLKRLQIQGCFGNPTDKTIEQYEKEIIILLKRGFLYRVFYGFKNNEKWNPEWTLVYTVDSSGVLYGNDDPGGIRFGGNPTGNFYSYLEYNDHWRHLAQNDKEKVKQEIQNVAGFSRVSVENHKVTLSEVNRNYESGNHAVRRQFILSDE